jgi:hypothetical protein
MLPYLFVALQQYDVAICQAQLATRDRGPNKLPIIYIDD